MTASTGHRYSLQSIARAAQDCLPAHAVDLVSIAAHVYAIDRSKRRGPAWIRQLEVQAVVSDREFWQLRRSALLRALTVLTDDSWDLQFVEGRSEVPEERQAWLVRMQEQPVTSIALFSGGLDSFAGAACWLNEHPEETLGLLSLCSSTVVSKIQRDLAHVLATVYPSRVRHLAIPLNLIEAPDAERSQRTRGFLYTAVATAAAQYASSGRVLIFENGYGSLNPRLVEHQQGSQATKSTHPFAVGLLQRAFQASDFQVRLELPHLRETKAELVARIPAILRKEIRATVSCDGFPLRRKDVKQCGRCGSCILRQQALRASGLQRFDRVDYAEPAFEAATPPAHLYLMGYQAWQFARCLVAGIPSDAVSRWPEIALGEGDQLSLDIPQRGNLLYRYGMEWQRLATEDRALGARLGWVGA